MFTNVDRLVIFRYYIAKRLVFSVLGKKKHHFFPPVHSNHDRKNNQIFDTLNAFSQKKMNKAVEESAVHQPYKLRVRPDRHQYIQAGHRSRRGHCAFPFLVPLA